jgi:hypothetical protein
MWSRLDDEFIDHPKVHVAGQLLGVNGRVIAIGFYAMGLMWANRYLTDGFLANEVIEGFASHVRNPLVVADALTKAGLLDKCPGGYRIHDFREFNPSATDIRRRRREDRERKRLNANGR